MAHPIIRLLVVCSLNSTVKSIRYTFILPLEYLPRYHSALVLPAISFMTCIILVKATLHTLPSPTPFCSSRSAPPTRRQTSPQTPPVQQQATLWWQQRRRQLPPSHACSSSASEPARCPSLGHLSQTATHRSGQPRSRTSPHRGEICPPLLQPVCYSPFATARCYSPLLQPVATAKFLPCRP